VRNLTLSLLLLCFSCAPPLFVAIEENAYVAKMDYASQRFIMLDEKSFPNAGSFTVMLNKKQYEELTKTIPSVRDESSRKFLRSIELIMRKQYQESFNLLQSMQDDQFDCQVKMLKTDCEYLLKKPSVNFQDQYQQVWDCTTSATVKSIVKSRFRLVNYGY
jgi:hypothetical protein